MDPCRFNGELCSIAIAQMFRVCSRKRNTPDFARFPRCKVQPLPLHKWTRCQQCDNYFQVKGVGRYIEILTDCSVRFRFIPYLDKASYQFFDGSCPAAFLFLSPK